MKISNRIRRLDWCAAPLPSSLSSGIRFRGGGLKAERRLEVTTLGGDKIILCLTSLSSAVTEQLPSGSWLQFSWLILGFYCLSLLFTALLLRGVGGSRSSFCDEGKKRRLIGLRG